MKNFLLATVLATSYYAHSQINIPPGLYKSRTEGTEILLKLNEDETFEMTFFHGKYTVEKDTIRFNTNNYSTSKFLVVPDKDAEYSSKLKLQFEGKLFSYYLSEIYLGTQKNANTQVEYRPLSDYVDLDANETSINNLSLEVPKCQFLYFVDLGIDGTEVTKFEVGDDLNKANITYNPYSLSNFKLVGYLDPETNKLAITDTKKAVFFTYEKAEDYDQENDLKPLSVETDNAWARNNGIEEKSRDATDAYEQSYYDFRHVVDDTFQSALNTLKNTPQKFLVVAFDGQNNAKQEDFKKFLKASEEAISSYMYDTYNEEYDRFNYYLANEKDTKMLKNLGIDSTQALLVFNSTGALLYHTSGTLTESSELFAPYNYLTSNLEKANVVMSIDKAITSKKATLSELSAAYKKTLTLQRSYIEEDALELIEDSVDDAGSLGEEAADSYDPYDPYGENYNDRKNMYALKSSKVLVQKQWESMIDGYLKNNEYNEDFVSILKKELQNDGFNIRLFGESNKQLTSIDFKLLDYVFKHYDKITASEAKASELDTYDYYNRDRDIASILEEMVFSYTNTNSEYVSDASTLNKTLQYYKTYLDISNTDFTAYYNYLNALKSVETDGLNQKYLDTYAKVFTSIVQKNMIIIESLDASYSSKYREQSWTAFKNNFANLANTAAWYVVENDTKNTAVTTAIQWSETSLAIEKNNHYYLDTLAQLYYKNGQKEKAITTEQKAIDFATDAETKSDYGVVLKKMKDGSY